MRHAHSNENYYQTKIIYQRELVKTTEIKVIVVSVETEDSQVLEKEVQSNIETVAPNITWGTGNVNVKDTEMSKNK